LKVLANYLVNPVSVIIATIFTFINFLVILLPFYLSIISIILIGEDTQTFIASSSIFIYTMLFMFIFTVAYLYLDLFFGFTVKGIIKDCIDINTLENFSIHKELFEEALKEFDMSDVKYFNS